MKHISTIGMGFFEKLFALLFPIVLGAVGWFLPNLFNLIKWIPILGDSSIIKLLDLFNPLTTSIILMFVGIIVGIFLSLTVYTEALKMTVSDQEIRIDKDDKKRTIKKSEVKETFMEGNEIVITGSKGEELLREKTDITKEKVQETLRKHNYPCYAEDPYADEFSVWTLEENHLGEQANMILYECRNALRAENKKKAKDLKTDLNELGIVVKDHDENQYVRQI